MSNNHNEKQSGERLTFLKLFNEKKYLVEIPIIQRDYAQGRASAFEVRETFLNALLNYLDENKPNRDLDFIYGSLKSDDESITRFIPLDGQQRLTTLFLLHWYLATISGKMETLKYLLGIKKETQNNVHYLSKFTYETRASSREFCDELVSNDIKMDKLLEPDDNKNNSLSKSIKNCGWYCLSWDYDPTIQSMLVMLDAIHTKFLKKSEFWERLVNNDNPIITFLFLNLDEFDLTDELYIKMNARGEPLTEFENFKEWLEKYVDNESIKIQNFENINWQEKIDTDWTDIFWKYKNNYSIDKEYMYFFRNMAQIFYVKDFNSSIDTDNEFKKNATSLATYPNNRFKEYKKISNSFYEKLNVFKSKNLNNIFLLLNKLENIEENNGKLSEISFFINENSLFEAYIKGDITYPDKVLFYALALFLLKKNITDNQDNLSKWMRVIRNLVYNTPIDSIETFTRAIKSVYDLFNSYISSGNNNFYAFLGNENYKITGFSKVQIDEEKEKAKIINDNPDWKQVFLTIENHGLFRGCIDFLIKGLNINTDNQYEKIDDFKKYAKIAINVFDENGSKNEYKNNYLLIRSLLAKSTIDENITLIENRENWRALLKKETMQTALYLVLKKLINSLDYKETLSNIISKYNEKSVLWKYYIVKNPVLLSCSSHTRLIKQYYSQIYLYNKNTWIHNDNQILLSNYRNEIITKLLNENNGFKLGQDNDWRIIKDGETGMTFYRGQKITLSNDRLNLWFEPNKLIINFKDNNKENIEIEYTKKENIEEIFNEIKELNFQLTNSQQNL